MAIDMFVKIGDIKGESQDAKHRDEIDVLGWNWSMEQKGAAHTGGGGGAGKVDVKDVKITKYVDKSSPNLMLWCSSGKQFPEAKLTVRKAGGENPLDYVTVNMKDVMITSVATETSRDDERPKETVTLNFAKVHFNYQPQKSDGSKDGGEIKYGWDIGANKKI